MEKYNILIVEDDKEIRDGIELIITCSRLQMESKDCR